MTSPVLLPATSPTDLMLIQKIASGDLQSLGVLFDRYEHDVSHTLRCLGVTPPDRDDLVQATFVQVITAAASFDARFSVRCWLLGIATMLVRRHRRALGRLAKRLALFASGFIATAPPTPVEALDSEEAARRMHIALGKLSPKRREAFVLVTMQGATGEEAAAALGIPINTLWTRLHHARRDMRAWLLEDGL
jgi:RNA polymerase sigma factor (sigma-70 family)